MYCMADLEERVQPSGKLDSLELERFNKATFTIVLEAVLHKKGGDFLVIFIYSL